jgi:hypothetical protein
MDEQKCEECRHSEIAWSDMLFYCKLRDEYIYEGSTAEENDCDEWEEGE